MQETILLLFSTHVNQWPSDTSNILKFEKYIVEIHTSNIIIEKNHKADINSTGFILQSSGFLKKNCLFPTSIYIGNKLKEYRF